MTLEQFIADLRGTSDTSELTDLCRKTILHGTPYVFHGREDDFYTFRKRIADKFDISFYEVFIVGSAKMGYSPYKRTSFSYDSDVDVSIVSDSLYDRIMDIIRLYQVELRRSRRAVSNREIDMYHTFLEYTALGWMRPDQLPLSFQVNELKDDWFDFFASLSYGRSKVGNYKVSAGVFRSYRHLELYILGGLEELKTTIQIEDRHE